MWKAFNYAKSTSKADHSHSEKYIAICYIKSLQILTNRLEAGGDRHDRLTENDDIARVQVDWCSATSAQEGV